VRVIAILKEAYGPFPKEEVSGSSTAMRCRSPCGVMVVMKWVVYSVREMVETR
jgi:hypothetical protein